MKEIVYKRQAKGPGVARGKNESNIFLKVWKKVLKIFHSIRSSRLAGYKD